MKADEDQHERDEPEAVVKVHIGAEVQKSSLVELL